MILCIDVGNTNIKYAIYDGNNLIKSFRVASKKSSTADEYGIVVRDLLANSKISKDDIEGIIMSSVIPKLNYTLEHMCEYYIGKKPIMIGPGIKTGLNLKADNAREVGADRIVNCVSAYKKYGKYGKPIVSVDFGTATTFNVISENAVFLGGVIAPGIKTSLDSLVNATAQLPDIELELPGSCICTNTVTNMQAGLLYGFIGLVDKIVDMVEKELKKDVFVVASGGMSEIIAKESKTIDVVDRKLTLDGLRYLYELNKGNNG